MEKDLEKKVIKFNYIITNFRLYESPLTKTEDNFIRENGNSFFFLNQKKLDLIICEIDNV